MMKVRLLAHTPDPERLIAAAAKTATRPSTLTVFWTD